MANNHIMLYLASVILLLGIISSSFNMQLLSLICLSGLTLDKNVVRARCIRKEGCLIISGRCVLETILLLRDQSLSGRGSIRERAVREAAAAFKSFSGLARKIKLAYTMLTLPAWNSLNLTVNYFSSKYAHHSGVSPSLPPHMKVQVCAKGDNDSQPEDEESLDSNEEEDDDNTQSQPRNPTTSSLDGFLIINLYFYFSYVFMSCLFKCYEIK
ncbi:unnamed protein product [Brassica oleracea var. botrytis]